MSIRVRSPVAGDDARWDEFVRQLPTATFFHRIGWKRVLERAFRHRAHYLLAERDGAIVGVLPLAEIRSLLFGHSLVSTPFCVYGGAVGVDAESVAALETEAESLAVRLGVSHLELRNVAPTRADWLTKDLYCTFRRPIDPDPDKNLLAIPRKQRAVVRKAISAGELRIRLDDDVSGLYDAYSESLRNLGTPIFARRYLQVLKEEFGADCEIQSVLAADDTVVAAVMSFYFRDEVLPYYGGGLARARDLGANDYMYWELLRRAAERGCRVFDYGRSKRGTGSFRFKEHWGFEPAPLAYQYRLVRAKEMPNLSPTNPRFSLGIEAWRRLPLGLSRLIGPPLARSLG